MPKLNWHPPRVPERSATYRWSAPHAAEVHEGEGRKPARRWTDYALSNYSPLVTIASYYQQSESVVEAFDQMAQGLNQEFRTSIESPIWNWPRVTVRHSGAVVSSPRDIVDTGQLRDSQSLTIA